MSTKTKAETSDASELVEFIELEDFCRRSTQKVPEARQAAVAKPFSLKKGSRKTKENKEVNINKGGKSRSSLAKKSQKGSHKGNMGDKKKSKRALKRPQLAKKMEITISKNNEIIYW